MSASIRTSTLTDRLSNEVNPRIIVVSPYHSTVKKPLEAAPPAPDAVVCSVLESVHMSASLISRAVLSEPFRIVSRGLPRAMFHAVVSGTPRVRHGDTEVQLAPGDVVLLPHGSPHDVTGGAPGEGAYIEELETVHDGSCVGVVTHGGPGPSTTIFCGSFELQHPAGAGMLRALPPCMVARGSAGGSDVAGWLDQTIHLLAGALDPTSAAAAPVVNRLTDILVIHVLRACAGDIEGKSWLAALSDPRIAKALMAIHRETSQRASVRDLAAHVGMSRSAFFARFTELVGEPPAQYMARWRVSVAADLMLRDSLSVAEVAERVGYTSEDAFARAFKRYMSVSPVQYRRNADPGG